MTAGETSATSDATKKIGGPSETKEERKSNPNHARKNETSAATGVQGSAEKNSETRPKAGGKRDNAAIAAPSDKTDATANPPSKKQKTKGDSVSAKDDIAATTNGEKRRRGRPKKGVKNIVKKVATPAAGGIGSRTRSQLKIS
jgi:hypothetical protein